jgi:hypothetical protein
MESSGENRKRGVRATLLVGSAPIP